MTYEELRLKELVASLTLEQAQVFCNFKRSQLIGALMDKYDVDYSPRSFEIIWDSFDHILERCGYTREAAK